MSAPRHVPVMLERCLDLLAPAVEGRERPVVVDGTLGLGGHTLAMLERFENVHVVGIDRDTDALERSRQRLAEHADRVTLVHAVYDDVRAAVQEAGVSHVDGALFDLGVSSMQLDVAERGFAYAQDAPLDMRMDPTTGPSAADVLNTYSAADLARVLRVYGEERFAKRIADAVVAARASEPFSTSARLVDLLRDAIPAAARRTGGHPAKRTFQALRIEVNDELRVWERALPEALDVLGVHGRLVVLSYHSLEDRITKRALARVTSVDVPPGLPVVPRVDGASRFRLLTPRRRAGLRGRDGRQPPARSRSGCAPWSGWRHERGTSEHPGPHAGASVPCALLEPRWRHERALRGGPRQGAPQARAAQPPRLRLVAPVRSPGPSRPVRRRRADGAVGGPRRPDPHEHGPAVAVVRDRRAPAGDLPAADA
ncbi:MAG: 16S rRNA (cytosine(1402)-N(4))-methyltransferase RsmH [Aeromicrobium erythreum]